MSATMEPVSAAIIVDVDESDRRAHAYRFFAALLGRELVAGDVAILAGVPVAPGPDDPPCPSGAAAEFSHALGDIVAALPDRVDGEALGALAAEYAHLFLGAGQAPAVPPYESAYRGETRLYGTAAAEMRSLLHRWGLAAPRDMGPEDHIAVELTLMGVLAAREAASSDQRALNARLLNWIPEYADRVKASARLPFYPAVAAALVAFLRADQAHLPN